MPPATRPSSARERTGGFFHPISDTGRACNQNQNVKFIKLGFTTQKFLKRPALEDVL
jgi:hypothetical protein